MEERFLKPKSLCPRIFVLMMVIAVTMSFVAVPADTYAAAKKSKPKCKITVQNANSNTVIKKGRKLKLKCKVTTKSRKKVKLRYRTSNRRIATVSKKGTIKAKKNGTVKITVTGYIKGRKAGSKTVKIKVGKPVTGIGISGYRYLRQGKSATLKASISPSKATNKKVTWSSSNPSIVRVSKSGTITGIGNGSAVITVKAVDGSGVRRSVTVVSHRFTADETHWIAHRGLHERATENTATAFRLAGDAGFWGCECDIWETRHVPKEADPVEPAVETNGEGALDVELVDDASDVEVLEDEEPAPEEDFDIVVNHDETFKRVFGVNKRVKDMSAEEIRENSKLKDVCFFEEYLAICKQYGMIPIIEIKDYDMSYAGIAKFVSMVNDEGLLETAQFISFGDSVLKRTKEYIETEYGIEPYTGYLIGSNAAANVRLAKDRGYTGVNISYALLTQDINRTCKNYGLKICTWTYRDNLASDEMLYRHIVSGAYDVYSATIDGKYYK